MMDIEKCMNSLSDKFLDHNLAFKDLLLYFRAGDYMKLLEKGENTLRYTVDLYQLYRELLLSLYELMPSVPQSENVYMFCRDLLGISVERSKEFDFPVYKITLPILLPNKRKRKVERNSVITESVSVTVSQFCADHHITPFDRATVIFLSHYQDGGVTVDNDNLDSAVIINSLNGRYDVLLEGFGESDNRDLCHGQRSRC